MDLRRSTSGGEAPHRTPDVGVENQNPAHRQTLVSGTVGVAALADLGRALRQLLIHRHPRGRKLCAVEAVSRGAALAFLATAHGRRMPLNSASIRTA